MNNNKNHVRNLLYVLLQQKQITIDVNIFNQA